MARDYREQLARLSIPAPFQVHQQVTLYSPPHRLPFMRAFPRRPSFQRPSNPPSSTLIPSSLLAPYTTATVLHRLASPLLQCASPAPSGGSQFPPFRNRRQPSVSIGGPPRARLGGMDK